MAYAYGLLSAFAMAYGVLSVFAQSVADQGFIADFRYWDKLDGSNNTVLQTRKDPWEGLFFTNAIGESNDCEIKAYFSALHKCKPPLGNPDG